MSRWYLTDAPISMAELFGGRLRKYGIREYINEHDMETRLGRCLFDSDGNMVPVIGDTAVDIKVVRNAGNNPRRIYQAICDEFGVSLTCSEADEQYQPSR